jgi:hypothetical protein
MRGCWWLDKSRGQCAELSCEQFLDPDRQVPDSYSGSVVDGVGDRRRGADIGKLAKTFDARRFTSLSTSETRMAST